MIKPFLGLLLCGLTLLGCSKRDDSITLQLNWKPEPEFGGFYAADYAAQGLTVNVSPGGAGTPTIDLLGAGKVNYAIVAGDEIPKARERGIHAVAIFAVYQTDPLALMTQGSRGVKSIEDLLSQPGTLAVEDGLPYTEYLKHKYGFGKVKVVPSPSGDLSLLRGKEPYAMQCFLSSEPLAAKKAGLDVTVLPVSASGFKSYACVLATTDEYRRDHADEVRRMQQAVTGGWLKYVTNPDAANAKMHALNPTMDADTFAASAAAQEPLLYAQDKPMNESLGRMDPAVWSAIVDQLKAAKVLTVDVRPQDCFHSPIP